MWMSNFKHSNATEDSPSFMCVLFVITVPTTILTALWERLDTIISYLEIKMSKNNMKIGQHFSAIISKEQLYIYSKCIKHQIWQNLCYLAVVCWTDPSLVLVRRQHRAYSSQLWGWKRTKNIKAMPPPPNHKSTHRSGSRSDTGFKSPHPQLVIIIRPSTKLIGVKLQ